MPIDSKTNRRKNLFLGNYEGKHRIVGARVRAVLRKFTPFPKSPDVCASHQVQTRILCVLSVRLVTVFHEAGPLLTM